MSFSTWHNYGIGINVDKLETTIDKVRNFTILSPNIFNNITEYYEKNGSSYNDISLDTLIEDLEEIGIDNGCLGLSALICEVIADVENIYLISCRDFDDVEYCIFPPMYPWNMTQAESRLTENDVMSLFEKYMSMLTDQSLRDLDYGHQEVENGG